MSNSLILVFAYGRPFKLKKVLSSLEKFCYLTNFSILIVQDFNENARLRDLVTKVASKFVQESLHDAQLLKRTHRLGLKKNILTSLREVCELHQGKVVILEDDCVLTKKIYDDDITPCDPGILYHINMSMDNSGRDWMNCWGWSASTTTIKQFLNWQGTLSKLTFLWAAFYATVLRGMNVDRWKQVGVNLVDRRHTWAIYYHVFCVIHGVKIHNQRSLIKNIGLDGSGESK